MFSFCSASLRERGQADQRVGRRPRRRAGSRSSSGATAWVRAGALAGAAADRLAGQDAAARFVARHRFGEAQAGLLPQAFVADEEERLVALERAADRAAELVSRAAAWLLDVVVDVLAGRVQRVVALVLEERAAEAVAAALADHGDVAAGAEAALGRRQARVDAELGDRFHRGLQAELRAGGVQVAGARVPHVGAVDAVVVQVVLLVRLAVEAHASPSRRCRRWSRRSRASSGWRSCGRSPAGSRTSSGETLTPIFADDRSSTGASALTVDLFRARRRRRARRSTLLDLADAEHDVARLRREAGQLDRHGVGARAEVGDGVGAVAVGDGGAHGAGRLADVTVTVTPGSAAWLWSSTLPMMRDRFAAPAPSAGDQR